MPVRLGLSNSTYRTIYRLKFLGSLGVYQYRTRRRAVCLPHLVVQAQFVDTFVQRQPKATVAEIIPMGKGNEHETCIALPNFSIKLFRSTMSELKLTAWVA